MTALLEAIRPATPSGRLRSSLATLGTAALVLAGAASGPHRAGQLLGAITAVALFAAAYRSPGLAVGGLVAVLPAQLMVSAALFHAGLPGTAAHALAGFKDLFIAALVLRVCLTRPRRSFDALDRLLLLYVALLTVYLVVPGVTGGVLGATTWSARLLEWRVLASAALLLFAARRLSFRPGTVRRLLVVTVVVAVVAAGCAVFEAFFPAVWDSFVVSTVGVPAYKNDVIGLDLDSHTVIVHTVVGGQSFVRAGSVFVNPLVLGFYLYAAWTIMLVSFSRTRARPAVVAAAVLVGAGILVTVTRSAVLGAVVAAFVVARVAARQHYAGRARLVLVLVAAGLIFAPLSGSTAVGRRTSSAVGGTDVSSQKHLESVQHGLQVLFDHPLGQGLGTGPGVGDRFGVANRVTSEDFYLGIGDEVGLLAMLLFVAMYGALLVALRRGWRRDARFSWLAGSLYAAGWGYAVGALFLHVWLDNASSLTFFGLTGVALACQSASPAEQTQEA